MDQGNNVVAFPTAEPLECPECGSKSVGTAIETQEFLYGSPPDQATLSAQVPVHTCTKCGFSYTDKDGENARHEAVCQHVGVLPPREVSDIRRRYGLTRGDFARLTRLGEASLARWETGSLIQNPANDQYLYLMTFPDNLARLRARLSPTSAAIDAASGLGPEQTFQVLRITETLVRRRNAFKLCPAVSSEGV